MAWLFLLIAAGFEVTFAMGMKYAEGFTRLWPSLMTIVAAVGGIYFLTLAMRELPVSIAYPIWTAIGSLGTVFLGFALLGESLTAVKLLRATAESAAPRRITELSMGVAATWPSVRRDTVSVMGPRCSFRPVIAQDDDGEWSYRPGALTLDRNATDRLVRAALGR